MGKHSKRDGFRSDIDKLYRLVGFFDIELSYGACMHPSARDGDYYELGATSYPIVKNLRELTEHTVEDVIDIDSFIFDFNGLQGEEFYTMRNFLNWCDEQATISGTPGEFRMSEAELVNHWDIFPAGYKEAIISVGSRWLVDE